MATLLGDLKGEFMKGTLNKLLLINLGVFLLIKITQTILFLFQAPPDTHITLINMLAVPADVKQLLWKPWTLITYMFTHEGFFHILFNLLWLYWMGRIFDEYLGGKKLLAVYLLGGIAGAALYILAFNLFPVFAPYMNASVAIGASAGVLAVTVATATLVPDYRISLMFIGPVALKYIALVAVLLDLVSISSGNAGGHIAHLGGALFGFLFTSQLKLGRYIGKFVDDFFDLLSGSLSKRNNLKVVHKQKVNDEQFIVNKKQKQEQIDEILDKISSSGYDSLTKAEKEILFKISNDQQPGS